MEVRVKRKNAIGSILAFAWDSWSHLNRLLSNLLHYDCGNMYAFFSDFKRAPF